MTFVSSRPTGEGFSSSQVQIHGRRTPLFIPTLSPIQSKLSAVDELQIGEVLVLRVARLGFVVTVLGAPTRLQAPSSMADSQLALLRLAESGVGSTIGAGVYILVGTVAREHSTSRPEYNDILVKKPGGNDWWLN
ncbi:hypothetical protein OROGR_024522 [Orobanche gracilis]